jgi:Na+/H+ antiporter NhaD/arsenite permease-like protein
MITFLFILGYIAIVLENSIKINKSASALITGVLCWTIYSIENTNKTEVGNQLMHHLGDISAILFFLLGAMTVVELIDAHDGFQLITEKITTKNKRKLLWIISLITFFLSAILDNLTTTIVMVSLLRKIIENREDRLFFVGMVVLSANAGGAWSPLGDVTTTMLWIGNQVTPLAIITRLFLPSLACLLLPLSLVSFYIKGEVETPTTDDNSTLTTTKRERGLVLAMGLGILLFVPVFKSITGLPPFMGMLLGLGLVWLLTERIHRGKDIEDKDFLSVVYALRKVDTPSILFFWGILMAIAALEATETLTHLATWLTQTLGNDSLIAFTIGLASAVVDNVPLVAAAQGMYKLDIYPTDHYFWEYLAYSTGTGGSILIIGSAAGVAAMGMEKIDFFWYLKRIGGLALLGYVFGAVVYMCLS